MGTTAKHIFMSLLIFFIAINNMVFASTSSVKSTITDAAIVTKINALYAVDADLNPLKINVDAKNGFVSLEGNVKSDKEFSDAVAIEQSVDGVKKVIADKLTIENNKSSTSDLMIESSVEANLIKHNLLDPTKVKFWSVGVKVENGNVYLSGHVDNEKQKENVIFVVKSTNGVQSVNADALSIKQ